MAENDTFPSSRATISAVIDGKTVTADLADTAGAEKLMTDYVAQIDAGSENADSMTQNTRERLRAFIARIERVEAEQADLRFDRSEIYKEVKAFGFDTPIVRRIVRLRKMEAAAREERDAMTDLYMGAVDGTGEGDIPLPGLPKEKKARAKTQARIKKETARDAQLAREQAAADAARAHVDAMAEGMS